MLLQLLIQWLYFNLVRTFFGALGWEAIFPWVGSFGELSDATEAEGDLGLLLYNLWVVWLLKWRV